ncbi:MAG: molybdate ABC transporter permease subunit [Chloroflexi bacterium]|nr:molybdate ABC transporter permease subunit [Chloroflexota bacterium]
MSTALDLFPLYLSLKVALAATAISFIVGMAIAFPLARWTFPAKGLATAVIMLPVVLPPTVVGYFLLVAIGRQGVLGRLLGESFGVSLVFTWQAAALASAVVSAPLFIRTCQAAFEGVDRNLEDVARTLGRSELAIFLTVTLPLAWRGILAGTALAFARALGEFGATLMVAGNIPGQTQTLPIAIYDATQTGNGPLAMVLVGIVTVTALAVLFVIDRLGKAAKWY